MVTTAKITSKGQITLPKEVRKLLDVQSGSVVVFEKKDNKIVLTSAQTLKEFKGILKSNGKSADFNEIRKTAKEYKKGKAALIGKR
ncbi:MAG: AbrB/MazE/SpoVT family DNA-binding domain-containing protein [Nitrospirae bacterium]|nr:AbrB/MazE/SpoVT family DNA-binding domain-containing protein [Nitrospirota bacterium]